MFLPFHDDNPTQRTAFVTYAIVAANVLCFVWFLQLPTQQQHEFTLHHGFIPARMTKLAVGQPVVVKEPILLRDRRGGLWQADRAVRLPADRNEILLSPLTCMFLHAGWVHLLSNMWFLWLFGNNIEDRLGHVVFLLFYVLGGLLGSGCHWLINPDSLAPTIGASGAVAAVLGAYAITWPWARIHTLVFLIVFITIVDLPALGVLGAWFLIQLMEGQGQLGLNVAGGVAWWAHVGGFVAGMVLM
ncbi:MAG: rhomboid family intramembrane serine protease, partial [Pirellulales bacterium]|nr:rhomboid family intramembrane serine protease [Pirellulales bacterium]